jgi:hypothetical protein
MTYHERKARRAAKAIGDALGWTDASPVVLNQRAYVLVDADTVERLLSLATRKGPHARFRRGDVFIDTRDDRTWAVATPGIDACGQVAFISDDGERLAMTPKPGRFRRIPR